MKKHLKVADLMTTAVITVHPNEPVGEAREDMRTGAFRHMPVVDQHARLIGIVSDRDLIRGAALGKRLIGEVMTRSPVTVTPDRPAHVAAELMLQNKFGALPVIEDDGRLVGVITETDFMRVARSALLGLPLEHR
jgi:CBS domain-containing membrane protein